MGIYSALPRAEYREQPRRMPRSSGFERYALSFNGSTNYVDCGNNPSLGLSEGTISLWIKASAFGNPSFIIANGASDDNHHNYYIRVNNDGRLGFVALGNWLTLSPTTPTLNVGVWSHIVLTFSKISDTAKVYKDGQFIAQDTDIGTYTTANNLYIGRERIDGFGDYFNGTIALVCIYNKTLSEEEIRWNMLNYHNPVHPEHLVLWLPMEEGSGLTVYDKSGNNNNGSLLPADDPPTWQRVRQWELRQVV